MSSTTDLSLLDDPVAQELLASAIPARLAYTWRDGTPRVVPIWFHWDGAEVVMASPSRAPKLRVLADGAPVAVTIDGDTFPYRALLLRGTVTLRHHEGVVPEYAAAAHRYFGQERGEAWLAQLPPGVTMWRIAVRPTSVAILDFETRFPSAISA